MRLTHHLPRLAVASLLALAAHAPARAELFDRGGGLIYDSTQNITWLAHPVAAQEPVGLGVGCALGLQGGSA